MSYRNIMLIDDDVDDQEIFLTALETVSGSVKCIAISNAVDALQKLSAKQVVTELIFLDLNMPRMNGQQFLLEIKKNDDLKDIPIIILSTSSHPATIELTKELGAKDFITKPDKFDELTDILRSIIG